MRMNTQSANPNAEGFVSFGIEGDVTDPVRISSSGSIQFAKPDGTGGYDGAIDREGYARALSSGLWRATRGGPLVTGTMNLGVERAQVLPVAVGTRLQSVAVFVGTVGAGSIVRLGARSDNNGRPGDLITEFGSVDSSASTGIKSLVIDWVVPSNRTWITACAQNGVAPVLVTRSQTGVEEIDGLTAAEMLTAASAPGSLFQSGVLGALPTTFTYSGSSGAAVAIAVQAA